MEKNQVRSPLLTQAHIDVKSNYLSQLVLEQRRKMTSKIASGLSRQHYYAVTCDEYAIS